VRKIFHFLNQNAWGYFYQYVSGLFRQHINFGRVWVVPLLCELYPGICLTTEEKARKNLSQGSRRVSAGTMKIHNHTLLNISRCLRPLVERKCSLLFYKIRHLCISSVMITFDCISLRFNLISYSHLDLSH